MVCNSFSIIYKKSVVSFSIKLFTILLVEYIKKVKKNYWLLFVPVMNFEPVLGIQLIFTSWSDT